MIDYIIIGQGIAGTCLAYELLKAGKDILVIDKLDKKSSSRVAAGIFNPMIFKRLTKSWKADEAITYLHKFYPNLEKLIGANFFHPRDFIKIFSSDLERETWIDKQQNTETGNFLGEIIEGYDYGAGKVLQAGFVDVVKLLEGFASYLKAEKRYVESTMDYSQISIAEDVVSISVNETQLTAKGIIFCEGANGIHNPWFNWLPFNLVKGDLLKVKFNAFASSSILNKGCFILPKDDDTYRVGSTYNWKDLSTEPSAEARQDILHRMEKIVDVDYEVINQVAGVRPASRDRRAFLGQHPSCNQLYVFNGLGTKGVILAPVLAKQMTHFIVNGKELEPEVNIKRYFKLLDVAQ